ncbi:hypothetical protein MHUMG1_05795 [Metarhizium humberi]|uniref:Uncharacterized protein n=1 Tax=Metarhizium humberi TaxID=2596975 RepID=A0A9P8MAE5_9HYPO|nr:hypothetical protein MHUMG1_05795 [Metarhizium humberi]
MVCRLDDASPARTRRNDTPSHAARLSHLTRRAYHGPPFRSPPLQHEPPLLAALGTTRKHGLQKLQIGQGLPRALHRRSLAPAVQDAARPGVHLLPHAARPLKPRLNLGPVLPRHRHQVPVGPHGAPLAGNIPLERARQRPRRVAVGADSAGLGPDEGGHGIHGREVPARQARVRPHRGGRVPLAPEEQPRRRGVVHAPVEQEPALVGRPRAPARPVVLVVRAREARDPDGEVGDPAEGAGLPGRVQQPRGEAHVLGHGEDRPPGGQGQALVERDQVLRRGHVRGDGLLGEHVLARGEGGPHVRRLGDDGQRDNDGLHVLPPQEVGVRAAGGVFRVEGRLGRVLDLAGRLLGRLERAGVEGFEVEPGVAQDGRLVVPCVSFFAHKVGRRRG